MKINMDGLKNVFKPKEKSKDIGVKEVFPVPDELRRENFSEGIKGDVEQAIAAREKGSIEYHGIASEELKNIIRKADEKYWITDSLHVLLDLVEKEKWTSFDQVDIEKLNSQLHSQKKESEEQVGISGTYYNQVD